MNIANNATETLDTGINPFGRAAILRACSIEFDDSTWSRAEEYAADGRVSQLDFNGNNTLTALVAGGADQPYELRVVITRGRENLSLRGICSCL